MVDICSAPGSCTMPSINGGVNTSTAKNGLFRNFCDLQPVNFKPIESCNINIPEHFGHCVDFRNRNYNMDNELEEILMEWRTINCSSISSATNPNCCFHGRVNQKSRLSALTHEGRRKKKDQCYQRAKSRLLALTHEGRRKKKDQRYQRAKFHPYLSVKISLKCQHQAVCERFVEIVLRLPPFHKFNLCYCHHCRYGGNDKTTYERGIPPMKYVLPCGWTRVAVTSPLLPGVENVSHDWHVAYHGTPSENVGSILRVGNLKLPGTELSNNHVVTQPQGHYTESCRPDGFDVNQIFVSPSPVYAGYEVYAKHKPFTDPCTGKVYECRVMFQLLIKPGSYTINKATVACHGRIDNHFENYEIEWSTKDSNNIMLCGLLITAKETSAEEISNELNA